MIIKQTRHARLQKKIFTLSFAGIALGSPTIWAAEEEKTLPAVVVEWSRNSQLGVADSANAKFKIVPSAFRAFPVLRVNFRARCF